MPVGHSQRARIAVLVIIIVISSSTLFIFLLGLQVQNEQGTVLTINIGTSSINFTMEDILARPSVNGSTGFIKTGTNPYSIVPASNWTGVSMVELLSSTGTLPVNYSLQLLSSDGYSTYFSMSEVQGLIEAYNATTTDPIDPRNFTMILAYMQNNEMLTNETGGPLRLVLLPDGDYLSAGHSWPKWVRQITVIDETEPWSIELKGVTSWNMTHDVYYSLGSCPHHRKFITLDDAVYAGVGLWTLIASIDGGEDVHFSFNNSLIPTNYTVIVWSESGSHLNFTSYEIAFNNDIIIAGWANNQILNPPAWPLKLVKLGGVTLDSIIRIEMTGWQT